MGEKDGNSGGGKMKFTRDFYRLFQNIVFCADHSDYFSSYRLCAISTQNLPIKKEEELLKAKARAP